MYRVLCEIMQLSRTMALAVNVPHISVTPEAEEDDDHNFMNLAEALTDIEELYDDEPQTRRARKPSKLKINFKNKEEIHTDLEDFEASDDDEPQKDNSDVEVDEEMFDECVNTEVTNAKGRRTSKLEFLTKADELLLPDDLDNCKTDVESDVDPDEDDNSANVDDSDINNCLDVLGDNAVISESNNLENINNMETRVIVDTLMTPDEPKILSLTDVECLSSEDDVKVKKSRSRRRKKSKHMKTKPCLSHGDSLNISDNEDENIPFPLCKKVAKKVFLSTPHVDQNVLTEEEDFEGDLGSDVEAKTPGDVDESILQVLNNMQVQDTCYSSNQKGVTATTSAGRVEDDEEVEDVKPLIRKARKPKEKIRKMHRQATLTVQDDGEGTDLEDMGSDAGEPSSGISSDNQTDSESCSEPEEEPKVHHAEWKLPTALRSLILLKEKGDQVPSIKILPLEDDYSHKSDVEDVPTDEENVETPENIAEEPIRGESPELDLGEDGIVCTKEQNMVSMDHEQNNDSTDEEILVENKKKKKAPTFKYMMTQSNSQQNLKAPKNQRKGDVTDEEDLYFSPSEEPKSLLTVNCTEEDALTDVEYLGQDSDQNDDYITVPKARHLTLALEATNTPLTTDSEDFAASGEEDHCYSRAQTATPNIIHANLDNSGSSRVSETTRNVVDLNNQEEVMYLKGGGFFETHTDVEEFFESANEAEFWEKGDWDASKESVGLSAAPKPATTLESTAAEGDAGDGPSGETQRAETEEGRQEYRVVDQHQLSDEMKQLLLELEKESKEAPQ